MDTDYTTAVLESARNVFDMLVHVDVAVGEAKTKGRLEFIAMKSITGNMNLISSNAQASIAVIIPNDVVINISNKVMPEPVVRVNEVVIDLVGEITNMIAGGVKSLMEKQGYLFNLSLPTIIFGSEYLVAHLPQSPITQINLDTELGPFLIEVCFHGCQDFCPLTFDMPAEFDDILF